MNDRTARRFFGLLPGKEEDDSGRKAADDLERAVTGCRSLPEPSYPYEDANGIVHGGPVTPPVPVPARFIAVAATICPLPFVARTPALVGTLAPFIVVTFAQLLLAWLNPWLSWVLPQTEAKVTPPNSEVVAVGSV